MWAILFSLSVLDPCVDSYSSVFGASGLSVVKPRALVGTGLISPGPDPGISEKDNGIDPNNENRFTYGGEQRLVY